MVELADTIDLRSIDESHESSSLSIRTKRDSLSELMIKFLEQYKGCSHASSCHGLHCEEKLMAFRNFYIKETIL